MTTIKTEKKTEDKGAKHTAPEQDDLKVACEIHTLAQILYRELATPAPWMNTSCAPQEFQPPSAYPPSMSMCGPTWTEPMHWPL